MKRIYRLFRHAALLPRCIFILTVCVNFGSLHAISQGTLLIGFDGAPAQPRGTQYGVTNYEEAGLRFTPIGPFAPGNQFIRNGGGIAGYPENGTAYLQGGNLTFSFLDGSLFGLRSVELAGYSDLAQQFSVDFVGYVAGGSVVTNSFTGNALDFRAYYFSSDFNDLVRVEVPDFGSLDNLAVFIPEPSSSALLAAWAGLWLAHALRRRNR